MISIGNKLHSNFGIVVGDESEETMDVEGTDEEGLDENDTGEEENDENDVWIPYQESRFAANRLDTTISNPNISKSSKYLDHPSMSSDSYAFAYPQPIEILGYMLESVRLFNSDRYGSFLDQYRDSGFDFLNLLRPNARRVLSSNDYSRET